MSRAHCCRFRHLYSSFGVTADEIASHFSPALDIYIQGVYFVKHKQTFTKGIRLCFAFDQVNTIVGILLFLAYLYQVFYTLYGLAFCRRDRRKAAWRRPPNRAAAMPR
ncbi:MAG: hypothetical protein ACLUI3_15565 [Christensenellales bacterium]